MSDEIVTLSTFLHVGEAETARAVLEMAGIASAVTGGVIAGLFGGAGRDLRLQVRAEDVERAKAILNRGPLGPDVGRDGKPGG